MTGSLRGSIFNSLLGIRRKNLKGNNKSYYLKKYEWEFYLEEAFAEAIALAAEQTLGGRFEE
jgi:hypothetical protein